MSSGHMMGFVSFYCEPRNLGELREFMEAVEAYKLPDSTPIDEGEIGFTVQGGSSPIQCGCSIPDTKPIDWYVDALITLHDCQEL